MKKMLFSIVTLLVIAGYSIPAFAKLEIVCEIMNTYGARYHVNEELRYIFTPRPNLQYYLKKYNFGKAYFEESNKNIASEAQFASLPDSSIMYFSLLISRDTSFLVYNDSLRILTKEYFYPFFSNKIGGKHWLIGVPFDSTQVLMYAYCYNRPNTMFYKQEFRKGNVVLFDATKDTVTYIPKVYFPEYNDSAFTYCNSMNKWSSYQTDYSVRERSRKTEAVILDYEYSKALESGDSARIASTPANLSIAVYDPELRSFKAIASYDNIATRSILGDTSSSERIKGDLPNGFYWVSTYYDDYYKRNYDTLNVYNFDTDSLSRYYLSGAFTRYHSPIVASFESNDGGIIFHNTKNDMVKWNPDGTFYENNLLSLVYYDSTSTVPAFSGDKAGNIYCTFNGSHELLKITPDGELNEMNIGPECSDPELYVYGVLTGNGYSNKNALAVFEDDESAFMYFKYEPNVVVLNNIRPTYYMVVNLNYRSAYSGVGNEPANSYLQLEKIYPNPASGIINFFVSANAGLTPRITFFKIIDESGAEVADLTSLLSLGGDGKQIVSFDVSRLATGTYIATAGNNICKSSRKFIVK